MRLPASPFLLLLLTAGLAAAQPEEASQGPRTLQAPEGFRVQMPGEPQVHRGQVSIPAGEVTTAAWTSQVDGVLYSISMADYPQSVASARAPSDFLQEGRDGLVNQLKGTVRDEQELTLGGHPGLGYTVLSEAGEVRARNYMVGRRLYTLLVLYNPSEGAPNAEAFLGSLQLTEPQQAAARLEEEEEDAPSQAREAPQVAQTLAFGRSVLGRLGSDSPVRDEKPYGRHVFQGRAGQRITVRAFSDDFHLRLQLHSPSRDASVHDDGYKGSEDGAVITRTLPDDGEYVVEVSPKYDLEEGSAYRVELQLVEEGWPVPAKKPQTQTIGMLQTRRGELSADDAMNRSWDAFDRFVFRGEKGRTVRVTVSSRDFKRDLFVLHLRSASSDEYLSSQVAVYTEEEFGAYGLDFTPPEDGNYYADVQGQTWEELKGKTATYELSLRPAPVEKDEDEEDEEEEEESEESEEPVAQSADGDSGLTGSMSASIGFGSVGEDGLLSGNLALTFGYQVVSFLGVEMLGVVGLQNTSQEEMFFSGTFGPALRLGDRSGISLQLGGGPSFVTGDGPAAFATTWGLGLRAELFFRFGGEDSATPGIGVYAAGQVHEGLDMAHFGFSAGF